MRRYEGKTVVVTGGSSGLGFALCERFLKENSIVIAIDQNPPAPGSHLEFADKARFHFFQCNLLNPDDCTRTAQKIRDLAPSVDLLINNAGISHHSFLRNTEVAVLEKVMNVNFFGSVRMTKLLLEDLIRSKGQIVAISSIAGFSPLLERTGYSASKHALHGFFDSLRTEIEALGVSVTLVCPSFISTRIESSALGGDGNPAQITRKVAGKERTPTEVAEKIFQDIQAEKNLSLPSPLSKTAWWISRIFPKFFASQMKKKMKNPSVPLVVLALTAGLMFQSPVYAGTNVGARLKIVDQTTGAPLPLVMVTESEKNPKTLDQSDHGFPAPGTPWKSAYSITRFTDAEGTVRFPERKNATRYRARKDGYKDLVFEITQAQSAIRLEREEDTLKRAESRPALSWLNALHFESASDKKHFRTQCAFCHQQGSAFTRLQKTPEEWKKTIARMVRYGSRLPSDLQKRLPEILARGWPELLAHPERVQAPAAWDSSLRSVSIKEWPIGSAMSQTHDLLLAKNGLLYVADNIQDRLYEIDPKTDFISVYKIPHREGEKNGGLIAGRLKDFPSHDSTSNAHSIAESEKDGHLFITPSAQRRLVEFDPKTKAFTLHEMESGLYPHTIRVDRKDRVWFTLALSNQIACFDREKKEFKLYDLPARSLKERFTLKILPTLFRLMSWGIPISNLVNIDEISSGVPLPYGIDITPDQKIWFARLHTQEIGSIEPETGLITMIQTPFSAPRRLRSDGDGRLWITSYAESLIASYDPAAGKFQTFLLPSRPQGDDTPYALHVDRNHKKVWATGNQSDSLMVLDVASGNWNLIPLPKRTFFVRDVDFNPEGTAYASNSNFPSWHIEDGQPSVLEISNTLSDQKRNPHSK